VYHNNNILHGPFGRRHKSDRIDVFLYNTMYTVYAYISPRASTHIYTYPLDGGDIIYKYICINYINMYTDISWVHMELFRRRRRWRRRPARFIGVMSDAAQGAFLFLFYFLTFVLRFYAIYVYANVSLGAQRIGIIYTYNIIYYIGII